MDTPDRSRYWRDVQRFRDERPKYLKLAETLEEVLGRFAARHAPGAVVQARAKTVASFAEKVLRKAKYDDPLRQLTDLAGARVVTYTLAQASAIADHVARESGIEIDRENSGDTRALLKTGEFGYRAVHYVLSLKGPQVLGHPIEAGLRGLKAEVQICTMLQHVWAAIGHDRIYKTSLRVPQQLAREIGGVAALLEACDARFASAVDALDSYIGAFDAYLSPPQIDDAITRWRAVVAADPADEEAIRSLGRLLMAAGRHDEAHETLRALKASARSATVCDLGGAAWRAGLLDEGRHWLETAVSLDPANLVAHCELGASKIEAAPEEAREHYAAAFALAPDDPRVLAPYIECLVVEARDASALAMLRGTLRHAIEECVRRIDLGVRLPESHFERARLLLYSPVDPGRPYAALAAYCKAIVASATPEPIDAERRAIGRLLDALRTPGGHTESESLRPFDRAHRLLTLGSSVAAATRQPTRIDDASRALLETIATPAGDRPRYARRPVVLVAGGCTAECETDLRRAYGPLVERGFAEFEGTLVCGGTAAGIRGMIGDLETAGATDTIVYLPARETVPETAILHPAYRIVLHPGAGHSPVGPLQIWADLLLAGIDPADVRVFGIHGGHLSAFEYVLALAMGARVGIVEHSGGAASELLADADWRSVQNLAPLPVDWATLWAFLRAKHPRIGRLPAEVVDRAAEIVHADYQHSALGKRGKAPDRLLHWAALPQMFKDSNRNQIAFSILTLRAEGFDIVPAGPGETTELEPCPPPGYEDKIEAMAEREHGRYVAERLAEGWRRGADDSSKKTNPTLVPWNALTEEIKDYDRRAVRGWIDVLAKAGYRVVGRG